MVENEGQEALERSALGVVGLVRVHDDPRGRGDRVGVGAGLVQRAVGEVVLDRRRGNGRRRAGEGRSEELARLVLDRRELQLRLRSRRRSRRSRSLRRCSRSPARHRRCPDRPASSTATRPCRRCRASRRCRPTSARYLVKLLVVPDASARCTITMSVDGRVALPLSFSIAVSFHFLTAPEKILASVSPLSCRVVDAAHVERHRDRRRHDREVEELAALVLRRRRRPSPGCRCRRSRPSCSGGRSCPCPSRRRRS